MPGQQAPKPKGRGIVKRKSLPLVPDAAGTIITVENSPAVTATARITEDFFETLFRNNPVISDASVAAAVIDGREYAAENRLKTDLSNSPRHRPARLSRIVDTVVAEKQDETNTEYQTHQLENFSIRYLEEIVNDLGDTGPRRTGLTTEQYKEALIQYIIDTQSDSQF